MMTENFFVLRLNSMTPTKSLFALLSNLIPFHGASNPCKYIADTDIGLAGGRGGESLLSPNVMVAISRVYRQV